MDAIQNQTETVFTTGDVGKGYLILSKGLLKNGCQQNSHGTEKTCKYLFAVLILLTLIEMLSQLNEIFSIEATHLSVRAIKHFTVSSQFVEVRQLLTRKQFS